MKKLNLLLLEDATMDTYLVNKVLERSGMDFEMVVVADRPEFIKAIEEQTFDAILADHSLLQFNGMEALQIVKEKNIDIPFILVTGTVSEEFTAMAMKEGAWDYILKDRLQRLPSAVLGALEKYKIESERKKFFDEIIAKQNLMTKAENLAHFGSWEADWERGINHWSDECYRILGYEPGEVAPTLENYLGRIHPDEREGVQNIHEAFKTQDKIKYDCRIMCADGTIKYAHTEIAVKRDENQEITYLNGFLQDITERKIAELQENKITADLMQRNKDLEQFTYIISHNLRAPLANITGAANMLAEEKLEPAEQQELLEGLYASVKNLNNVVTDLNEILQVKYKVHEHKERVSFTRIVNDIKSAIRNEIEKESVVIKTDFSAADDLLTLTSYMHSIFYNLISNSIKYRQPHLAPVIEISSCKENGMVALLFKDNGMGIDLAKRGHLVFGLYRRFHPNAAEGKGMGLFMVKTQVETLGGRITLNSSVNNGTEFKIEFEAAG